MAENSKSIWVWLGCGCAAIMGLGIVVIAVVAFFGFKTAKSMADPVARQEKALDYMSAAAVPEGYETQIAMKVPFVAEMAVLQGDRAQFVYLGNLRTDADLAAAFADDESFDREVRRAGLKVRHGQTLLARETLQLGRADLRYALFDGEVEFDATANTHFDFELGEMAAEEDDVDAEISGVLLVRCSADEKPGLGLWAGPRADADGNDQAAFRGFVEQFGFCSRPAADR